jgi:tetratricopeptide (TPR) repeat protein
MHRRTHHGRGRRFLPAALFGLLAATLLLGGCDLDTLLEAEDPFSVTPGTARDTANLTTLYAGSRSQFALSYAGQQNREGGIVMMSGLMSDELYSSDSFTSRWEVDTRTINYDGLTAASDHSFIYLQRARAEALNAIDVFEGSPREGNDQHAELYNIAGYSVTLLAENFCSGIPLSRITESGVVFGEPLSTQELYELAIGYFDDAIAQPDGGAYQQQIASVGKARALLDLGRFAEAAQVATQVPDGMEPFLIEYASGSFETPNAVFNMINEERRFSVALQEGTGNPGLPFGSVAAGDPRIELDPDPVIGNAGIDTYLQLKYPSQSAPIPLATALEARLIEAEAALDMGASGAYLGILNDLRADVGLGALADPGTAAARVDQFFAERAYFLWLTGHRLSDLRRLIRQYGRTQDQVFPTGVTPYGLPYGTDVSMPVPFEEINNPNYTGCTDTGA